MSNPFHAGRERREEQDRIQEQLTKLQAEADAREPRVNALWRWARSRKVTNGIGGDFEWDLSNPRRFGEATSS